MFQTRTGHLSHSTEVARTTSIEIAVFQTRTGHLSHSTSNASEVARTTTSVSNPDGPPLPFHLFVLLPWPTGVIGFKPGRATSPIPPWIRQVHYVLC